MRNPWPTRFRPTPSSTWGGEDAVAHIPATVASVGQLDLAAIYDEIMATVERMQPGGSEQIAMIVQQVSQMVGVDIRQDALGTLGRVWSVYIDEAVCSPSQMGLVLHNRPRDSGTASSSLTRLATFANGALGALIVDEDISI